MKSIRDIYKIGKGPSSSHTIGPERAANLTTEQVLQDALFKLAGELSLEALSKKS